MSQFVCITGASLPESFLVVALPKRKTGTHFFWQRSNWFSKTCNLIRRANWPYPEGRWNRCNLRAEKVSTGCQTRFSSFSSHIIAVVCAIMTLFMLPWP